jgi:hypothetical protein
VVNCKDCVHLAYIDGPLRCQELEFLIWPELIKDGIDCNRFQSLAGLKNFKTFTGYSPSNNREVVEELVLEALLRLSVINGRIVSAFELSKYMGKLSKSSLHKILNRLVLKKRAFVERRLVHYPAQPRRKYWIQFMYGAVILKGKGVYSESQNDEVIHISGSG